MRVLVYSTGIAWNELVRGYASVVCTSSYSVQPPPPPHTHTHTHILIPFEDCELTGLKVEIACCTQSILSGIHCQVFFYVLKKKNCFVLHQCSDINCVRFSGATRM